MRCELILTQLMLLLHVQQMIDEIIAFLMLGTSQPKGLPHKLTKETIVGLRYDLGSQIAWQTWKESIEGASQGQATIILGHFAIVLGHRKR